MNMIRSTATVPNDIGTEMAATGVCELAVADAEEVGAENDGVEVEIGEFEDARDGETVEVSKVVFVIVSELEV